MIARKCQNSAEANRDGVIKPTKSQFLTILILKKKTENCDALNATNQPKSTVELGYMFPRGLTSPPAVTLTK